MTQPVKKTFLFSCDYEFLPLGVTTVHNLLDEALKKADLPAWDSYDYETSTWTVECSQEDAEKVYSLFHEIVSQIVLKEFEDYDSDDEDQKRATQKASMANKLVRLPVKLPNTGSDAQATSGIESGMDKIELRENEQVWSYDEPDRAMDRIIPLHAQEQIALLTGSQLTQNLNMQKIYIRSQAEANCNLAMRKLDTLLIRCNINQTRMTHHVFYSEDNITYHISMRSLLNVRPELVRKTLINKEDLPPGYGKIGKANVLRYCAPNRSTYKLVHGRPIVPVVSEDQKNSGSVIWKNYKYPKKGDVWSNPLDYLPADEIRELKLREEMEKDEGPKTDLINRWMEDIPSSSAEAMMQPLEDWVQNEELEASPTKQPLTPRIEPCHVPDPLSSIETLPSRRERRTTTDLTEIRSPGPVPTMQKVEELIPSGSKTDSSRNLPGSSMHLLDSHYYHAGLEKVKSLTPVNRGDLHGTDVPTLQPPIEFDSKKYHNTTRHRKPKDSRNTRQEQSRPLSNNPDRSPRGKSLCDSPFPTAPDPSTQFSTDMDAAARMILSNMRRWRGDVRLEAQIGRILIRGSTGRFTPGADKPTTWDQKMIEDFLLLARENGVTQVGMTKVITSAISEEQYLLQMLNRCGDPMWQTKETDAAPPMLTVKYEFKCWMKATNVVFVVVIDAETFTTRVTSSPAEFGAVNVHCLLRNWDYRVVGIIQEDLYEHFGHIAEIIVASLYIPEGLDRPTLMFEMSAENNVEFLTIRAIRSGRYLNTNGAGSVLRLDEVYDMNIDHVQRSEDGVLLYYAYTSASKVQRQKEPAWLEVSVSSREAEGYLAENKDVELGEETTWTEDDMLAGGVLPTLCIPACHLVKHMDGVGAYNDNDWQPQPKENTAMTSPTTPSKPAREPTMHDAAGFW